MRTTLVLDDEVLRQAKKRAADRNVTISEVVNEALRAAFARPREVALPFTMITYGGAAGRVRHDPKDFVAALEAEDLERLR